MEYLLYADPGPEAVRLAEEAFKGFENVDKVIFTSNQIDKMGKFIPGTKSVVIDLERVVKNRDLVITKGMFLHIAIWCNLVYTIYHEAAHAQQFQQEGWAEIPQDMDLEVVEAEAHAIAFDKTADWFISHEMPPIPEMGYLGRRIADHMNHLFAMGNPMMEEEVSLLKTQAAGRADVFTRLNGDFDGESESLLFDRIDEGAFGCLHNGVRYLKANEILAARWEVKDV